MKKLTLVLDWTLKACFFAILVYFALVRGPERVELVQAQRGLFEFRVISDALIRSKSRYTVTAFADGSLRRLTQRIGDEVKQGSILTEILIGPNYESIRAAVGGVVSKVHKPEGGKMERKDPILEISDPEHIEIVVELPPADAAKVHLGDEFTVTEWGGPEPLRGVVSRIGKPEPKVEPTPEPTATPEPTPATETTAAAEGTSTEGAAAGTETAQATPEPTAVPKAKATPGPLVVTVTGEVQNVPEDLFRRLGKRTQAPVSIQVAKFPDALKLPLDAVFKKKNEWTVFRVVDGRAREKKVTVSNQNNTEVMIGAGLNEGDSVIVSPSALVKDSVRVEAK